METASTIHGNIDGAVIAPMAARGTQGEYAGVYAQPVPPFGNAERDPVGGYQMVVAFIARLLFWSRPPHVTRLVMTIYIFTIDRMLGRWLPTYIVQKLSKRFKAALHSFFAIIFIRCCTGIFTSLTHTVIGLTLRGALTVIRGTFAVRNVLFPGFSLPTSTRLNFSAFQMPSTDCFDIATLTFAPPRRPSTSYTSIAQHGQSPDFSVGEIAKIMDGWMGFKNNGIFCIDHFSSLIADLVRAASTLQSLVRPVLIIPYLRGAA